jgi:3-hydroxybutyryl-CoA dehydrogenase
MGSGIAEAFAQAGAEFEVRLCDVSEGLAQAGKDKIARRLEKRAAKGQVARDEAEAILGRVQIGTLERASDSDLVLEAVVESADVKRSIFAELDAACPSGTLFASNTSSLSITQLSEGLGRPLVGMHFFNPAPVMRLVEVVAGLTTPAAAVADVTVIVETIGKVPVVVADSAGFVVNRIAIPMINEAVEVLAEGVASAQDIDQAMRLGVNHPMGPLALGDLIGLDVVLAIMRTLQRETGLDKYRPAPLLVRYVRAGRLGRKSGRGFHDYRTQGAR